MEFIDLKRQYHAYREEVDQAVFRVIHSCRFILGEEVSLLEKELAHFTGAEYAVGVGSGTDALLMALMASGAGPGCEVITTPFTFIATAEVIALLGARPVFVDIDPHSFNMDVEKLGGLLEERSRRGRLPAGIIPVSLYGLCSDMDEINALASEFGLFVIEDACQSLGAAYKGSMSCSLTQMAAASFFPSKPLGCFGDGGMIFTAEAETAKRLFALREHGQIARYRHEFLGINGRLDALQASVLRVKLRHFPDEIRARRKAAACYSKLLEPFNEHVVVPAIPEGYESVFAQYTVRIRGGVRDEIARFLNDKKIPTAIHYPMPLHLQRAFSYLGYEQGDFPEAEKACHEVLSLPMHAFLEKSEQEEVVDALGKALKNLKKI